MKQMKKHIAILLVVMPVMLSGLQASGQEESPTNQLKPTIASLFAILDDVSLKGNQHVVERRAKIMAAISDRFDFREMSKRVLGQTWHDLSDSEKDHFVTQVTKLLENVYIGKLESYGGRDVEFVAERIKGKRAQVTTLVPYEGSKIPIHYIMQREQDEWMVYDINIEGVSLVRNYMEQFSSILREQKYQGLIKVIEEKNKTFAAEYGAS
jgi:phospholipid transport system substrate-binding protein